ncbi:MAG: element excision factor XisI family protein [Bacteroidota bacterium]
MIIHYPPIILAELTKRAQNPIADAPDLKKHLIVNQTQTEFILLLLGWDKKRYTHSVLYHIELRENKVWVHEDNTSVGIAAVLAEKGIPKLEIVLGYLPWYEREASEYGLG